MIRRAFFTVMFHILLWTVFAILKAVEGKSNNISWCLYAFYVLKGNTIYILNKQHQNQRGITNESISSKFAYACDKIGILQTQV